MKNVLAILLSLGFLLFAAEGISAQQKPVKKSPADTTRIKIKIPQQQNQKQNIIETKKFDLVHPRQFMKEPVLLMKEKEIDTLQKKKQ